MHGLLHIPDHQQAGNPESLRFDLQALCQGGCAIYETRYPVCRGFYCAWRTVDIFGPDWRPDKSGVLPYVETEGIADSFDLSTGIGLMLVGNPLKIVRQRWFQEFVVTGG